MKLQEILSLLIGFMCGYLIFEILNIRPSDFKNTRDKRIYKNLLDNSENSLELYEQQLADKLFNEVKIFCWVFTHPENHKIKVPHVRNTWGRRCNKLLFMSIETDPQQPDIIALPVENGRSHLWNKTKLAMKYVHDNYLNDYDWFMRADDDNYVLMENLRFMLSQYNPKTSLYLGCRFAIVYPGVQEGYHAGGGHIFSRKALKKFVELSINDNENCVDNDSQFDDVFVGKCLKNHALFIDDLDDLGQKRFFPVSIEAHLTKTIDQNIWYWNYLWRNVTQGNLKCCSDTFVEMHYIKPGGMRELEFLIYHLHPFGLEKNLTETLPRKLPLDEIIKASDKRSFAGNFREHEIRHTIDDDEKY